MRRLLERLLGPDPAKLPPPVAAHIVAAREFSSRKMLGETDFIVFDTELTGLDVSRDSMVSIGAVRMRGGLVYPTRSYYSLVKPETALKGSSVVIHELTHTDLESARPLREVLAEFIGFAGGAVMVGFCVDIDAGFVNRAMLKSYNLPLRSRTLDTVAVHEWLATKDSAFMRQFGRVGEHKSLGDLAQAIGIEGHKNHDALSDAYITAQLFQRYYPWISRQGVRTIGDLFSALKNRNASY